MKKLSILFVLGTTLAILLSACGPSKVTIDVNMQEYSFDPASIEVSPGAEVTVNLTNSGTLEHEMVLMVLGKDATAPFSDDDEGNIFWEAELQPGDSATVTFTAPTEPGEYQMVCGTPAHLEQGMVGTFTVK